MKRYLGIDLHTNSFTCCYLHADGRETIRTWPLQGGGLEQFIQGVHAGDEVALEATGNAAYFCKTVGPFVARVVVIAPWQFEVIRRSVKKTDKHDARAIARFLSKDMLPEARIKSDAHVQLASLITTRDQLVKLRVSLLGKVHGMFVRHGLKIKREVLTSQAGFTREVDGHAWNPLEGVELAVIDDQLQSLHRNIKRSHGLAKICGVARRLKGDLIPRVHALDKLLQPTALQRPCADRLAPVGVQITAGEAIGVEVDPEIAFHRRVLSV